MDIQVSGLKEVMKRFQNFYDEKTEVAVGDVVETYARKMANEAAGHAPIKDGFLRNSLASSPEQEEYTLWTFGSDLPYALRQEYEHATRKGFVRKAIWDNRSAYRKAILKRIIEGK